MDRGDVLVDVRSEPPVAIRRCGERILLAATAAGPVGGDVLALDALVGADSRADVGSVGALIVWPGPALLRSSATTHLTIEDGAHVEWRPEPTISVAGSDHRTSMSVDLAPTATCVVVEEVALGRSDEAPGTLELVLRVARGGAALVHHAERFGPGVPGARSSISVGHGRYVLAAVVVGAAAGTSRVEIDRDGAAAWMPVADDAAVVTAVGRDRPTTRALARRVAPEVFRT